MTWKKIFRNMLISFLFFVAGFAIFFAKPILVDPDAPIWELIFNLCMAGFGFTLVFRVIGPIWTTLVYKLMGNRLPEGLEHGLVGKLFVINLSGDKNV